MKKNTSVAIFFRAVAHTTKATPIAGMLSLFYNIIEGLFPAFITSVSALLFDIVSKYLNGSASVNGIYWYGGLFLLGYAVKQLFQYISSITINAGVYEKVTSISNRKLYEKCASLPLIDYENSDTMNRKVRAAECVNREIVSQLYMMNVTMVMSVMGIISVVAVLSRYSLWFIPISLFSILPYFIVRLLRGKEFYRLKKQQVKKERYKDYLWSLITNKQSVKEMRIMGFGDYIVKQWMYYRDDVNEEMWKLVKKDSLSLLICDFIRILGYGICIAISFALTINDKISVGVFGACITAFASVQNQTKSFLIELGGMPEKINYAKDYFSFIDAEEDGNKNAFHEVGEIQKIELQEVGFCYPNSDHQALKGVSIQISPGEKIAIIGENGSGKTTLAKLLMGIYKPDTGHVSINGVAIQDLERNSYLKKISLISQSFVRYCMTLRENVAISNLEELPNDSAIRDALSDANFRMEDVSLELDTMLGKEFDGVELSGGQWQKIAIARGIFKESEVIIMDEPTSAIDPIAETEILKAFLEIAKNKTAIIISHRTGLCTLVDKIAVMKEGNLVEYGSHDSLIKEDKEYARMFHAQKQWYV
jgi:ABC-type multidrug transport system fused ATPase/permease subunit